jgi:hypothetical protein
MTNVPAITVTGLAAFVFLLLGWLYGCLTVCFILQKAWMNVENIPRLSELLASHVHCNKFVMDELVKHSQSCPNGRSISYTTAAREREEIA